MNKQAFQQWCHDRSNALSQGHNPLVMGILNVTPDSFADGGRYFDTDKALEKARQMIAEGADILDVGGESTRPGAHPISLDEELARVLPVIERIRAETDIVLAIDTNKPEVMVSAVKAGAAIINDITALQQEKSLNTAAQLQVPVCLMHMQGSPLTMQHNPHYAANIIKEINHFFEERIAACLNAGILRKNIILDPGFGFGKTVAHNMEMIKRFDEFHEQGLPLLIGLSRKHSIGVILDKPANERLTGSIVLNTMAALKGVGIIRTHDVEETRQMVTMIEAVKNYDNEKVGA